MGFFKLVQKYRCFVMNSHVSISLHQQLTFCHPFLGSQHYDRWLYTRRLNNDPPPQVIHVLIPGTCEYITLRSNRDLADVINLRILRRARYPGLFGGSTVIIRVLVRRRQEAHRVGDLMPEAERVWTDLRKEPKAKECRWLLEARGVKETGSPLEPTEGIQICWHLDVSL